MIKEIIKSIERIVEILMSKISKQLHILRSNNDEQFVSIFDSIDDVDRNNCSKIIIDNNTMYIALGDASDENASALKFKKNELTLSALTEYSNIIMLSDSLYRMTTIFNGTPSKYNGYTQKKYNEINYIPTEKMNTDNLTKMNGIFQTCQKVRTIDVSNFNTENIKDMSNSFFSCTQLETVLGLQNLDTKNVTDMNSMFGNCNGLKKIDLSCLDTSSLRSASDMFSYSGLRTVNVMWKNTSKLYNITDMFNSDEFIKEVDISTWDTSALLYCERLFKDCRNLNTVKAVFDLSSMNDHTPSETLGVENMFLNTQVTSVTFKNASDRTRQRITPELLGATAGQTFQYFDEKEFKTKTYTREKDIVINYI